VSLKDIRTQAGNSSSCDFKTASIEFYEGLLAGVQGELESPQGVTVQVSPNSVTLSWPLISDVITHRVEIKQGSVWSKVYEGLQGGVVLVQLTPNSRFELRVFASNALRSSHPVYLEATTTAVTPNKASEEDDLDFEAPKNYGALLRNDAQVSDIDFCEIDELEHEIFGKFVHDHEKLENSPVDGKDPFFDVFLTSEEYRRVVAAAHDQLHRRKILLA